MNCPVDAIEFERKLKPAPHIAVAIDADYGQTAKAEPVVTKEVPVVETESEVVEEVVTETVEEESTTEPEESSTQSISELFGS